MRFPAAIRVGHHVAALSGRDSHGNDIVTYTPPRDALGTPVAVFAIAPAALTEPVTAGSGADHRVHQRAVELSGQDRE